MLKIKPYVLALMLLSPGQMVWGCGPFLPTHIINADKRQLLLAPEGSFAWALQRIPPVSAMRYRAHANDWIAERQELEQALQRDTLTKEHQTIALTGFNEVRSAIEKWGHDPEHNALPQESAMPSLPEEFKLYLQGALAYHANQLELARERWEHLLALPAEQRRYKTVWALYMLGKVAFLQQKYPQAVNYFTQVRSALEQGFPDSQGFAAASLGEQARAELKQRHFASALELYYTQLATGTESAYLSTLFAARQAFFNATPEELTEIAQQSLPRRILTAYMIAVAGITQLDYLNSHQEVKLEPWLKALQQANSKDLEDAPLIAWGAYHAGRYTETEAWLALASKDDPIALWIQAKLHLRAGKYRDAAAALVKAIPKLPDQTWFAVNEDTLTGDFSFCAKTRASAELAMLHLAKNDYVSALDILMKSANWADAAYIAERILSLKELVSYVNRNYPTAHWSSKLAATDPKVITEGVAMTADDEAIQTSTESETSDSVTSDEISDDMWAATPARLHHLLARRLAREDRWQEALPYYPPLMKPLVEHYLELRKNFKNPQDSPTKRAQTLWEAAQLLRRDGLLLIGTEQDPDWFLYDGQYEEEPLFLQRVDAFPKGTTQEQQRAQKTLPNPNKRYHYRYKAAELAWQASLLLPDQTDETATMLTKAGSWLKNRDPKAAMRFYKALATRCSQTALGKIAVKTHWFPELEK